MNKILILGGGVAGSSLAHYLKLKNYDITIIDINKQAGGLARTCYYAGHPYEFGPHIWFWPGGFEDPINNTIYELSDHKLFYIDRKLNSYIEKDKSRYKYPIHYSDIENMPEKEQIYKEFMSNRDGNKKLIEGQLPTIGDCTFKEYFSSAIGDILYNKFMSNYTHKMWNIPGSELQTSMVWADRFKHAYSKDAKGNKGIKGYDPIKFEEHTLGKGIKFQVYPEQGWNIIWNRMTEGCTFIQDEVMQIYDESKDAYILLKGGDKYHFKDYKYVINTIDIDKLWGKNDLPYTGRMMIPLLLPDLKLAFPEGIESLHYSGAEFQTRVTEMKIITKYESKDTLILIEVPVLPGSEVSFPLNTIEYAKENNLFYDRAYPQQSKEAFAKFDAYIEKGKVIKNLIHCGRHAEFKYWGMPETVNSAYQLSKTL